MSIWRDGFDARKALREAGIFISGVALTTLGSIWFSANHGCDENVPAQDPVEVTANAIDQASTPNILEPES